MKKPFLKPEERQGVRVDDIHNGPWNTCMKAHMPELAHTNSHTHTRIYTHLHIHMYTQREHQKNYGGKKIQAYFLDFSVSQFVILLC